MHVNIRQTRQAESSFKGGLMVGATLHLLMEGVAAFYIGHSLVGPTLPRMMDDLVDQRVEYSIINGAPLEWIWDHSSGAEGRDGRDWLPRNPVEALVLTERVPLHGTVAYHDSGRFSRKWVDLAAQGNPQVQPFLYESWHSLDSGTGVDVPHDDHDDIPWRARLDQDLPLWRAIVDEANRDLPPGRAPMKLIPAGQAMARLSDAIDAGEVPGLDSIRQLFSDDIHPNELGFYFVAMVHYASITGESPVGLPTRLSGHPGPTPEQARILQEIARQTVAEFPTP